MIPMSRREAIEAGLIHQTADRQAALAGECQKAAKRPKLRKVQGKSRKQSRSATDSDIALELDVS